MSSHPVERLSAFLDHELEDAERRGVAAHLAACPSCARHLRELAAVDALARALPPAAAPDGYLEALPGRVRRRIRADRPISARAPWVWPLAAGLALAVIAPLVLLQQRPRYSPPPDGPPVAMGRPAAPATTAAPTGTAKKQAAPPAATAGFETEQDTLARAGAQPQRRVAPRVGEVAPRHPAAAAPREPRAEPSAARRNQAADAMVLRDESGADAPAFAPPPPTPEEKMKQDQAVGIDERGRAAGAVASTLGKSESAATPLPTREERAFRALAALPLSTPGQARHARGAWLRFLTDFPRGERRDEALVRVVEASVAAFRSSADPGDRLRAQRDADAYLSQPDAPQAARVEAALRRLDEPR